MNVNKLLFATFALLLFGGSAFAQSGKLKRAKKEMAALNFRGAIQLYNEVLQKTDDAEAKINIAECYRRINDPENAEYWYGQVVRLPEAKPKHKLFYGQMLQRMGKCDLAKEWYEKYVADVPGDVRGQYLVKACDYEDELRTKSAGIYEISHMDFNSNLDDFSPAYYGDGIVFASERDKGTAIKRTHGWTGNPFLELYYLDAKPVGEECGNYMYGRPEKFSKDLNSKYHDAAVAFNSDQSEIFFTRNNYSEGKVGKSDDGIIKLKIYSAKVKGKGDWDDLEGLPFNSDEYSVMHPTLNADGTKLYFSSDMPGGFGERDLYVAEKEDGRWGPAMNLGPTINTEGNEIFPFYHAGTKRLYFSSDGQVGLGGLDIYYIEEKEGDEWGPIENIGYPINTIADDFSIVFNEEGTCGYLASDREGGVGRDDVYSFRKVASPVQILVYDENTREPIEGADVLNACTGDSLVTGPDGIVTIDMKMNLCCTFTASKEEYNQNSAEGCTKDIPVGEQVFVEIPLKRELNFVLEGAVFDAMTQLPLAGVSITLTNDCEDEEQTVLTDDTGVYKFTLKEDCCYTLKGDKEGYIASTVGDQCTRGLTESTTLQANLELQPYKLPEGVTSVPQNPDTTKPGEVTDDGDPTLTAREGTEGEDEKFDPGVSPVDENGTIAFLLHIYYDFDQSYIRNESEGELNKLLKMLEDNPSFVLEIGSHTDSRGTHRYNRRLSQRRAESVVRWLSKRGVERNRLIPVGYGETINVNNCRNNIPCSEQEHQMNRRTEFRVIGRIGDVDKIQTSRANPNARIDVCAGCPF